MLTLYSMIDTIIPISRNRGIKSMSFLFEGKIQKLFIELAEISSPSFSECIIFDFVEQRLQGKSLDIVRIPYTHKGESSENMVIYLRATNLAKKSILFDAHADTVKPCENVQAIFEDGIIRSDGRTILGADDKAGIVAMILAIEEIMSSGIDHGDLCFLISSAEEVGLIGARYVDSSLFDKIDYGIILDGEGSCGTINIRAAYHYSYDIEVRGIAAHAGLEPEKGINAIQIAASLIQELPSGRLSQNTVANVACISGGSGRNVVPDLVTIQGEFRSLIEEDCISLVSSIEDIIFKFIKKGHSIQYSIEKENQGYAFSEETDLVQLVSRSMKDLNIIPKYESSCGGTNANIYVDKGLPCVVISVGMENIHSTKEFIRVDDLVKTFQLILQIIKNS